MQSPSAFFDKYYNIQIVTGCHTITIKDCAFINYTEQSGQSVQFACRDHLSTGTPRDSDKYFQSFTKNGEAVITWNYSGRYSATDGKFYSGISNWTSETNTSPSSISYFYNPFIPYVCEQ